MSKINWSRVILGGLLATVILLGLGMLNLLLFQGAWIDAVQELGHQAEFTTGLVTAGVLLYLVVGVGSVWLYAAIRPRYGPGPKTATFAGLFMWVITSAVDVFWVATGLIPSSGTVVPLLAYLPILVVATNAGAWVYKEVEGST